MPETIESIRILSLNSDYRTTIVNGLIPLLKYTAKLVERRNSGPPHAAERTLLDRTTNTDSRDNAHVVTINIIMKAARWLLDEWLSLFKKRDNLTLRVIENSYYDTLIRAWMYGVRAPRWLVRLIVHLIPKCDLWILLDMEAPRLQSHNGEVSFSTIYMNREFVSFITRTGTKHVILDSSKPVANVTENAYASIIETIALRTEKRLGTRFK